MGLDLPGMVPAERPVETAGRDIDLARLGRDLYRALQRVQLGPDREHVEHRRVPTHLPRQRRVALARRVARAHEQAAGVFAAQRAHELAPQGAERGGVHEHHALARQPDATVAGREMNHPPQVGVWRQLGSGGARRVGHGQIIDKSRRAVLGVFQGVGVHQMITLAPRRVIKSA